jgi:hypothetical protein
LIPRKREGKPYLRKLSRNRSQKMSDELRLCVSKQLLEQCMINSMEAQLRTLGFINPSETLVSITLPGIDDVVPIDVLLEKEVTTRSYNGKEQT